MEKSPFPDGTSKTAARAARMNGEQVEPAARHGACNQLWASRHSRREHAIQEIAMSGGKQQQRDSRERRDDQREERRDEQRDPREKQREDREEEFEE